MVCKLDLEKAYDRVDWDFLFWTLRKKGFGNKWISWMTGCVMDSFFFILVDGTFKSFSKSSRGLLIDGFEVGDERQMVTHL